MADYKIISADSHAEEPGTIYEKLPEDLRHRKPHIEVVDGHRYQILDGQHPILLDTPNPLNETDLRKEFRGGEDVGVGVNREWGTDVELRLKDQAEDGVSAEVIYPNGIFEAFSSPEPRYQLAVCSLYNDFYWDVFSSHSDVCIPSATIPVIDVDAAVAEVKRIAAKGYRSLSVPVNYAATPYNMPVYEPFWATVAELGLPLSFHVFTTSDTVPDDKSRRYLTKERDPRQRSGRHGARNGRGYGPPHRPHRRRSLRPLPRSPHRPGRVRHWVARLGPLRHGRCFQGPAHVAVPES